MRGNEHNEYYGPDFSTVTDCKMKKVLTFQSTFKAKDAVKQHHKPHVRAQGGHVLDFYILIFAC